jgi:dynein heavy chain
MKNTSVAALGISNWTKAIIQYDDAMKVVKPKQIELKAAKEESAKATAAEDLAKESLAKVEAAFAKLSADLLEAQQKEASLKQAQADYEYKLDLAKSLINNLGGEKENWIKLLALRKSDRECLVGDTIVCSGFLAYLGVFVASYRISCVTEWVNMLAKFQITCTKDLSLVNVLGDPVKIAEWQKFGLPQDNFSSENGVIWDFSDRWTLSIDPQMQANKWLKNLA